MVKKIPIVPLLEQFIKESANGRRRKINGERIKASTVEVYRYSLRHLRAYEECRHFIVELTVNIRNNHRLIIRERNYWKWFYQDFSDYLLYEKGFFDNFTGSIFKTLKTFFRYLKNEKYLLIQECYERFYVRKEDIRVVALLPEQYCFLILDQPFAAALTLAQKRCKDLFVFGCAAALRYTDLCSLRVRNVEEKGGHHFLVFRSPKTNTPVQVKLPLFAIEIYRRYARNKKPGQKLFPAIAAANFDKRLKMIGEKAGWIQPIGKERTKNGIRHEIKNGADTFRFCDQLSTHLMRKTGITVLLMLGMPEFLVRKVSGHASGSKEFFRYVNFAQAFITDELDKAHQKLLSLYRL